MEPILINLRADNSPPADAPAAGELSSDEVDANFTNLKLACEQLDAETLKSEDAEDVTEDKLTLADTDEFFVIDNADGGTVKKTTRAAIIAPVVSALADIETILASI